jgi:hypothetical protein
MTVAACREVLGEDFVRTAQATADVMLLQARRSLH